MRKLLFTNYQLITFYNSRVCCYAVPHNKNWKYLVGKFTLILLLINSNTCEQSITLLVTFNVLENPHFSSFYWNSSSSSPVKNLNVCRELPEIKLKSLGYQKLKNNVYFRVILYKNAFFQGTSNGLTTCSCSASSGSKLSLESWCKQFLQVSQFVLITSKPSVCPKAVLEQTVLLHPLKHYVDSVVLQEVVYCSYNGKKRAIHIGKQTDRYNP